MTRRPAWFAATLLALLVANGCGSSSKKTAPTTTAAPTTTTSASKPPVAPKGKLLPGEYAVLVKAARLGKKADHVKGLRAKQTVLHRECGLLAAAPGTPLMQAQRRLCGRGVGLVAAVFAFTAQGRECKQAAAAGDISCYAQLFSQLARSARSVTASAYELNAALRRRGLRGRCAKGIGLASASDLKAAAAIGKSARGASQAAYARDEGRFQEAARQLDASFKDLDSGSNETELAQLRTCPHS
ncbi:MAG: hypothetical protein ACJ76Z_04175 [Thermoleophilaceae bacterium]